jgi:hypothetical protein
MAHYQATFSTGRGLLYLRCLNCDGANPVIFLNW